MTITGRDLSGRAFRYAVTVALHDEGRDMTIHDLVRVLEAAGLSPGRAPAKAVSDALARSTRSWMRSVVGAELR